MDTVIIDKKNINFPKNVFYFINYLQNCKAKIKDDILQKVILIFVKEILNQKN